MPKAKGKKREREREREKEKITHATSQLNAPANSYAAYLLQDSLASCHFRITFTASQSPFNITA
jgi:hypothetical protein